MNRNERIRIGVALELVKSLAAQLDGSTARAIEHVRKYEGVAGLAASAGVYQASVEMATERVRHLLEYLRKEFPDAEVLR